MQLPVSEVKEPLVRQVSRYVFHVLKCFGVYGEDDLPSLMSDESKEGSGLDYEAQITPLMNVLSAFRDKVKTSAGEGPKALF